MSLNTADPPYAPMPRRPPSPGRTDEYTERYPSTMTPMGSSIPTSKSAETPLASLKPSSTSPTKSSETTFSQPTTISTPPPITNTTKKASSGNRVRLYFRVSHLVTTGLRSSHLIYAHIYLRRPLSSTLSSSQTDPDRPSSHSNSSVGVASESTERGGVSSTKNKTDELTSKSSGNHWILIGSTERRRSHNKVVEWSKGFDIRYTKQARMKARMAIYDATHKLKGVDRLIAVADFRLDEIVGVVSKCEVPMKFVVEGGRQEGGNDGGRDLRDSIGSGGGRRSSIGMKEKRRKQKVPKKLPGVATITAVPIDILPTLYHFQIESDPIVLQKTARKKKLRSALYTIRSDFRMGDSESSSILLHCSLPARIAEHDKKALGSLSDNPFTAVSVRSNALHCPSEKIEYAPVKESKSKKFSKVVHKSSAAVEHLKKKNKYIKFDWASVPLFGENHLQQELTISFCASDGDNEGSFETAAQVKATIEELQRMQIGSTLPVTLFDSKKKVRIGQLRMKEIERGDSPKFFHLRFEAPQGKK